MSTRDTADPTTSSPEPSQLTIAYGPVEAGSGHRGMPIIFTNVGESMCRLSGYPEVTALDANGEPVAQAKRRPSGYLGGVRSGAELPVVDLMPGQSASAMVEALAFNRSDGSACTAYTSMLVTLPGASQAEHLEWECDGGDELYIHPVVPDVSGQQP